LGVVVRFSRSLRQVFVTILLNPLNLYRFIQCKSL